MDYTPEGYLWFIWGTILGWASSIPYNHPAQDRLSSVVVALHQMVGKTPRVFLEGWNRTYQLWQDLPIFGSVVADEFQAIRENANFIAYLARLTRDGVRLDDFANGSMYRVVHTREWRKGGHQRGDPTLYQFIPRPELDREVAMAAAWIFIAGPQLVQQMDSSSRSIRVEDGYFWIKRLKEIRDF